jgi:hypothetical protein
MIDGAIRANTERLFHKAGQHEYTLEKLLPDHACADELVGFHACQAVRKMLEAVLSLASVGCPKTQDLPELIDLVRENVPGLPQELEEARRLNPFGQRQDACLLEAQSLDRPWVLHCVRGIRRWAESTRDTLDPEGRQMREEMEQNIRLAKAALGKWAFGGAGTTTERLFVAAGGNSHLYW